MSELEKDPATISHAYFYEQSGAWSTSNGIDWANSKNIALHDI